MCQEPVHESLDRLLAQICRLHYSRAHSLLEELGLYRGQPPMLHALREKEGRTHSELAAHLQVQPSTMTKMVQRLERAGFVERRSDPEDERVSRVYLTPAGRTVTADMEKVLHQIEGETFASFTDEERARLRRYMLRIRDNLMRATGRQASL
jgi:DNA-binding MarR family transcriptional regulator